MTKRVYLDTNVFIAAFEVGGAVGRPAWDLITAAEAGGIAAVTSELTLAELLSKSPKDNPALCSEYSRIISDGAGLKVVAVSRAVLIEVAAIRSSSPATKLPDAIHLATARLQACSHLVSDDARMRPGPGLATVRLGPLSLRLILQGAA